MNERIVSSSERLSVEFRVYGYERAMSDTPLEKYRASNSQSSIDAELTHNLRHTEVNILIEYILYSLQSTISRTRPHERSEVESRAHKRTVSS